MLDKYMCTEKCPCLEYGDKVNSKAAYVEGDGLKMLASHGRSVTEGDGKIFMNFTDDPKVGFKNFDDCYASWVERAKTDTSIDVDKVFALDAKELWSARPYHPKRGRGDHDVRHHARFILKHLNEIEMYEDLEDEYFCSGMCKSSLFYFG